MSDSTQVGDTSGGSLLRPAGGLSLGPPASCRHLRRDRRNAGLALEEGRAFGPVSGGCRQDASGPRESFRDILGPWQSNSVFSSRRALRELLLLRGGSSSRAALSPPKLPSWIAWPGFSMRPAGTLPCSR